MPDQHVQYPTVVDNNPICIRTPLAKAIPEGSNTILLDNYNLVMHRANLAICGGIAFYKNVLHIAEKPQIAEGGTSIASSKKPICWKYIVGLWMGPEQLRCLEAESR
jgi:hypothetical protein